jgi:predicted component of type VI protein secretion system
MPRIRVKEGDRENVYDLTDGVLVVGRSPDNHVVLTDRECSRHHCHFERVELGYKMVDLESRNGTKANGRMANQHLLQPGDLITIGKAELRFEDENGAAGRAPAPAAPPAADRASRPAPRASVHTGRAERPRRAVVRPGGDATKWVLLLVLLLAAAAAVFILARYGGDRARPGRAAASSRDPAAERRPDPPDAAPPARPADDAPAADPRRDGAAAGTGDPAWDTVQRAVDRHLLDNDYKEAWLALRRFLDGNAGHGAAQQRLAAVETQARDYASTLRAKMRELVDAGRAGAAREEGQRALDLLGNAQVTVFDDLRRQIEEELQKLIPP